MGCCPYRARSRERAKGVVFMPRVSLGLANLWFRLLMANEVGSF